MLFEAGVGNVYRDRADAELRDEYRGSEVDK
jgi:hypothetical protein